MPLLAFSCNWSWLQLGLWPMCGIEGVIVALFLQLIMVATGVVANMWDGGCHCRRPLALRYSCSWACGQNVGWRAPLSLSSCTWS